MVREVLDDMVVQTKVFLEAPDGGAYFVGETIFDVVENLRGSAVRGDFLTYTLESIFKVLLDVVIYQVKERINIELIRKKISHQLDTLKNISQIPFQKEFQKGFSSNMRFSQKILT